MRTAGEPFGVNLFAPNPVPVDLAAFRRYADAIDREAAAAGGHSGTLTPDAIPPQIPLRDLLSEVRARVRLPLLAAGGLSTTADVAAALRAGATAAVVGTALLRTDESGAAFKGDFERFDGTAVTRAFTGRPARGLRNGFLVQYTGKAPAGYPALHHLTSPLRKAAIARGDVDRFNLWAGTGYRLAAVGSVASVFEALA